MLRYLLSEALQLKQCFGHLWCSNIQDATNVHIFIIHKEKGHHFYEKKNPKEKIISTRFNLIKIHHVI